MRDSQPADVTIGVDIGGTGMKGGVVNGQGAILAERSVRTPVEEGRAGILRELEGLIAELRRCAEPNRVTALGIGTAGRVDPSTGNVLYATDNLPGWTGTRLAEEMSRRFGLPVFADNDVNAAAVGEAWVGTAQGCSSVAFVAMGTGVGGALHHDGRLIHGRNGGAGEVGHMILVPDGLSCNCGQRGCWEQYVSGTALNRAARSIHPDWDSRELFRRYQAGDASADQAVREFIGYMATGLISLRNMYDPDLIVLGGGLAQTNAIWRERLEAELSARSPKVIPVAFAALGNKAGIIGAARMAMSGVLRI